MNLEIELRHREERSDDGLLSREGNLIDTMPIRTEHTASAMKGVLRALRALRMTLLAGAIVAIAAKTSRAQDMTRVRDLTIEDKAVPVRLMGYGLVIGLDGTGDKSSGGKQGGMSVNSIVNLLRRFGVELPVEALKSKNVAAVLVTSEVSPYLRTGGKFEVHVSSIGDARSLRGGVLWSTPLLSDVGSDPVATAQGPMLMADLGAKSGAIENSARIPDGGLLEIDMPHPKFAQSSNILLKEPDVMMATRIAKAINLEMGDGTATVDDPGSISLNLKDAKEDRATLLARIQSMRVQTQRVAKLIIDSRDGTIIAGGDLTVGEATVSHGGVTLTIGVNDTTAAPPNAVRMAPGTPVTKVASALHAIQAPPNEVAAIFESLRAIGAIACEIEIR
jgi:flagellar P-ring protein precursor FlgI